MINRHQSVISTVVIACFVWFVVFAALPLRAAEHDSTGVVQKEASPAKPKAGIKRILPWLIGGGAVVLGVLTYFLFIKKDKEQWCDDFDNADPLWTARRAGYWTLTNGIYSCTAPKSADPTQWFEWSLYNRAWSKPDYTVTVRMKVPTFYTHFLLLSTTGDFNDICGYAFYFSGNRLFLINKINHFNYYQTKYNTAEHELTLTPWKLSEAILTYENWNEYKIVKAGTSYKLFANNTEIFSFTDSGYDPRYFSVNVYSEQKDARLDLDSVSVDVD